MFSIIIDLLGIIVGNKVSIVGWLMFFKWLSCSRVVVMVVFEWLVDIIVLVCFFLIKFIVILMDVLGLWCIIIVFFFIFIIFFVLIMVRLMF